MKLRYVKYLGRFYEINGYLGWLPWHEALFMMIGKQPKGFTWVPHSKVIFEKRVDN